MSKPYRTLGLIAATVAVTAAATNVLPGSANQAVAPAVPTVALMADGDATPAGAPLVSGLPDFTRLVEHVGPAVVNIEATSSGGQRTAARGQQAPDDDLEERLREFFGPDMPFPGMPGRPGGPRQPQPGPRGMSQGSGFLISADGYNLTNHHVVDGADKVLVKLTDHREFNAKVIGSDQQSDVAVLKIAENGLPYLRLGDSGTLKPGQWVIAIGSPFGLDHSVTAGIVSGVGRAANPEQRYVPFIQSDVAINPGNSGGPLLNTRGEVVGINSQIFSNFGGYMGVSFSIPMDVAMNVVDQLKRTGKVSRGQIGVVVGPVSSDAAKGFSLPDTRGALVSQVLEDGPADKAGLEPGDVIRAVDGVVLQESSDLPPLIGGKAPGSSVKLQVLRDGKTFERTLQLSQLSETGLAANDDDGAAPDAKPSVGKGNPLGVIGQDLTADDRKQMGLRPGEGVGVARVDAGPARQIGLRQGDVILRVGTAPVGNAAALDRELAKARKGQTVMLLVRRGNQNQFVAVPIEDDAR